MERLSVRASVDVLLAKVSTDVRAERACATTLRPGSATCLPLRSQPAEVLLVLSSVRTARDLLALRCDVPTVVAAMLSQAITTRAPTWPSKHGGTCVAACPTELYANADNEMVAVVMETAVEAMADAVEVATASLPAGAVIFLLGILVPVIFLLGICAQDVLGEEGALLVIGTIPPLPLFEHDGHYWMRCMCCGTNFKGRAVPGGASGSRTKSINQKKKWTREDFAKEHGVGLCDQVIFACAVTTL
jgi:hypothetical protein